MPVIRSGAFRLYGYSMSNPGTATDGSVVSPPDAADWYVLNTGFFPTQMPCEMQFAGPEVLDTTTEGTGWDAGAPPPGFNVHSRPVYSGPALRPGMAQNVGVNNAANYSMGGKGPIDVDSGGTSSGGAVIEQDDPLLTYIALLDPLRINFTRIDGFPATFFVFPKTGRVDASAGNGPSIEGGYDIIAWWWKIPDAQCGITRTSKYTLSIEQPANEPDGGVYEKLDPNDSDAAPTPVIDEISPNHGPTIGGTVITVQGSGFGKDFDLKVDGVTCDDLVYTSQYEVTGRVPAHVVGLVNVVLINADGVST